MRGLRATLVGKVVKISGEKTVSVEVVRSLRHKLYKKVIKRSVRYLVHDEDSRAVVGDVVEIMSCRPISKLKTWRLLGVELKSASEEG
jgi:small subunit ribosomal protein S17